MASIRITIETDGAAFQDDDDPSRVASGGKVALILRAFADIFAENRQPHCYRDADGNVVAKVEVIK